MPGAVLWGLLWGLTIPARVLQGAPTQAIIHPTAHPMNTAALNFKALPISERIQLVEDIWDSIADETPSPLQLGVEERAELQRRLAEHQADPSSSIPWEQVRASLFKTAD